MAITRKERQEIRLSAEEKAYIEKASEMKNMTVSDFMRSVAVEMARAIATNKSPQETYHAVLMGVGRVSPEVVLYSATADTADLSDYAPLYTKPVESNEASEILGADEENDEEET